ncbi:MAG: FtsH protease activity modulator HflK [Alphaproteobacteria bacterium]|nr:FtsH protease activity modulator HflK [Alphaproteobacteria bacterium]
MSRHDKGKNPWGGKQSSNDRGKSAWGGGASGGGQEPPDMDEILRNAQNNFKQVIPSDLRGGKVIALGVLAIVALWLASGFYIVNPGEHAVIQRFGAWSKTQTDPGLGYHLPSPIEEVSILNVEEIRKMNIGFSEAYSRSGVIGMRDVPEESLMLTSDRNIIDLDIEIQWNIKSSEDFLFEIRDQENTIKKVAESAIREIVGQTNMFPIITNKRQEVADKTKRIIQKNLDEYKSGVNITQVLIQQAEVHPDVQDAFQDVQSAKQDAEDVQNRAGAYREDILPKARGKAIQMLQQAEAYKQAIVARSNGDAKRFESIYTAYLNGKDVTKERIYIETMEGVLRNAEKIIIDNEVGSGVVPYLPLDGLKKK